VHHWASYTPLFCLLHCIQSGCVHCVASLQLLHQLPSLGRQAGTHVHASCVYTFIYLHIYLYMTSWLARKWMKKSKLATAWKERDGERKSLLTYNLTRHVRCTAFVMLATTLSTRNKNGPPTPSFQFHSRSC
jgi:hypothetical protein